MVGSLVKLCARFVVCVVEIVVVSVEGVVVVIVGVVLVVDALVDVLFVPFVCWSNWLVVVLSVWLCRLGSEIQMSTIMFWTVAVSSALMLARLV